jgi:hypothetical protein
MMQFAAGAAAVKELAGLLGDVIEDPDTYKRIEGLRTFISKIVGHEIDKNGFLALLEQTTQGDPYTGKWENINDDAPEGEPAGRRLRVEDGYIYDIGRGNAIFVRDK